MSIAKLALFEQVEGPDAIFQWGGWGGVLCGWQSPDCLLNDALMELRPPEANPGWMPTSDVIDAYHEERVGQSIWPRNFGDELRAEELMMPCEQCGRTLDQSLDEWAPATRVDLTFTYDLDDGTVRSDADAVAKATDLLAEWLQDGNTPKIGVNAQVTHARTYKENE